VLGVLLSDVVFLFVWFCKGLFVVFVVVVVGVYVFD